MRGSIWYVSGPAEVQYGVSVRCITNGGEAVHHGGLAQFEKDIHCYKAQVVL
jgi:hypothetical protein